MTHNLPSGSQPFPDNSIGDHRFHRGQLVIHTKTGVEYVVDRFCKREHDNEPCVVYCAMGSAIFCVRPEAEFNEKFKELVDDREESRCVGPGIKEG